MSWPFLRKKGEVWENLVGGDWNMTGLWLSIYWECHHPNWRTPSFFREVGIPWYTTNQLWMFEMIQYQLVTWHLILGHLSCAHLRYVFLNGEGTTMKLPSKTPDVFFFIWVHHLELHHAWCDMWAFYVQRRKVPQCPFFFISSPITRGYGSVLEALSKLVAWVAQPRFTLDTLVDYTYP